MLVADADLVERSRNADADAFGELVTRHQQLVFGVAFAQCRDRSLAEDVAQEAFVAAWRDLDRLRDGDRVGSWVAGIARNLASSAVRRRVRREAAALEPPAGEVASPEDEVVDREDRELLGRALGEVPEAYREALVLFYFHGESIAAIAGTLGVREDLVKQRLARGRRALRDTIAQRVESALTRTRLSPAFRAGVLAAVAAAGAGKATAATTAGKAIVSMSMKKIAIAALSVAAVGGGALWLGVRATAESAAPSAPAAPRPAAAPSASPTRTSPSQPVGPLHAGRIQDPKQRIALRQMIRIAREHHAAAPSTSSSAAPALPDDDDLDKQYIREAVRELIPLIGECYEEGLARDPTLAGTIVVNFTIEGEPSVGGVIGESAVDPDKSTISDPAVRECIQETMYALKIDPPASGLVRVTYPFSLRPVAAP